MSCVSRFLTVFAGSTGEVAGVRRSGAEVP